MPMPNLDKLRVTFEKWADESYGGNTEGRFFRRCGPPFESEYEATDVEMAWRAFLFGIEVRNEVTDAKPAQIWR